MKSEAIYSLNRRALLGLPGEIVTALDQYTEADQAGLLGQLLTAFGNACGKGRFLTVEDDNHGTNLFLVLFGDSSNGRKGTSLSRIMRILERVDPPWRKERVKSGLVSGEGLIHHVRDATQTGEPSGINAPIGEPQDKRLLVSETEFAQVLNVMAREGNTLSAVLRNAWDGKDLTTLAKNSPEVATGAHVSIIGHITSTEITSLLSRNESANGFGNRFLWCKVKRSKILPFPKAIPEEILRLITEQLACALDFGKRPAQVILSETAIRLWEEMYTRLTEERFGMFGAMTARAAPQVLRVALIYSIFARSEQIEPTHLEAAEAFWNYCDHSCKELFSRRFDSRIAEPILTLLAETPSGLSRTEISNRFQRNRPAAEIDRGIKELLQQKLIVMERRSSGCGRPTDWFNLAEESPTASPYPTPWEEPQTN
jgi:hypothetical protein